MNAQVYIASGELFYAYDSYWLQVTLALATSFRGVVKEQMLQATIH